MKGKERKRKERGNQFLSGVKEVFLDSRMNHFIHSKVETIDIIYVKRD